MDILRKSDADLAALYNACCIELRRRAGAATCDDLAIIRSNEMAKRALTVALAGNHSILFIGPPNSGKSMLRAAALALPHFADMVTLEARPCPCGHFGSPRTICNCTDAKITKHRAGIPVADITVETSPPTERDLIGRPGTGSAEIIAALAKLPAHTSLEIGEECRNLLKAACSELNIDADGRQRILAVARSIANLDHSPTIQPSHLCEAINYRAFRR